MNVDSPPIQCEIALDSVAMTLLVVLTPGS
jgi:hypothetical protein